MSDDTKPGAAEQYSDAIGRGQARDIVGAAGMAGRNERVGALLWRALHGGDRTVVVQLRAELFGVAEKMAVNKRWPGNVREHAKPLAATVLQWYLADKCPTCTGRKYQPVPGVTQVLSTVACPTCRGTGRSMIERLVPMMQVECAKQIAVYLDLAEQRMSDKVRAARSART